jgi:uncharacterized spore protein YtfJ
MSLSLENENAHSPLGGCAGANAQVFVPITVLLMMSSGTRRMIKILQRQLERSKSIAWQQWCDARQRVQHLMLKDK